MSKQLKRFRKLLRESLGLDSVDLGDKLKLLKPKIAEIAQEVYDYWDEEDVDTYAGGGICHLVADKVSIYLDSLGISAMPFSLDWKQHVVTIAFDEESQSAYMVDIPENVYETGGGFSWKKIQDVEITDYDVEIQAVNYNDYVGGEDY